MDPGAADSLAAGGAADSLAEAGAVDSDSGAGAADSEVEAGAVLSDSGAGAADSLALSDAASVPGVRAALPSVARVLRLSWVTSYETGVSDMSYGQPGGAWPSRRTMRQWFVSSSRSNSILSSSASAIGSPRPPSASSPGISFPCAGVNI